MTDIYETTYYTSLSQEFRRRAARALAGMLNPACADLRRYLVRHELLGPGEPGSFLADPVFEAMFGWKPGARRLGEMSGTELPAELVRALAEAPEAQRLSQETRPYQHQVAAWEALRQRKSIVVTSGTSSGKTECYLVPILADLLREAQQRPLTGVRALFLYPLNALINSQRDRLSAWSRPFGDRVRFSLYNGEMPEHVKAAQQRHTPEEVVCREQLRDDPPPILVTNATMLEYMLVRLEDQPILSASQGRLRWIVLDEAHSYLGSQAADVALLLRRVMHAFAVRAQDLRFVATSATIRSGRGDDQQRLAQYLSDVTGLPTDRIEVISGNRETPPLPAGTEGFVETLPEDLQGLAGQSREERFLALAANPGVRRMRAALSEGARTVSQLSALLHDRPADTPATPVEKARTLEVLDLSRSALWEEKTPLLPLRGHFFHRTQSGLWACMNRACPGRAAAGMDSAEWPFGAVYQKRLVQCEHVGCRAMVYPLALCSTCGTEYLLAQERHDSGEARLTARGMNEEPDELDRDEEPQTEEEDRAVDRKHRLLMPLSPEFPCLHVQIETGRILDYAGPDAVTIGYQFTDARTDFQCRRCRETERRPETLFRPVRAGGPFFLSVAIPALLEHTPPAEDGRRRPAGGRRTITFTDSRQGTARFAAQAQLDSERNYFRSWVYQQTWAEARSPDPEDIESLRSSIADLEKVATIPAVAKVLAGQREDLARMLAPAEGRLEWTRAAELLAGTESIRLMQQHWRGRGSGPMDAQRAAQFCLYREFVRRPKRQNSLETLGLVQLRYPAIESLMTAPAGWSLGVPAWRSFLQICVDFYVRAYSAVRIDPEFLRWMGTKILPRKLVAPDEASEGWQTVAWAQIRVPSRPPALALLLLRAMNLNPEDRDHREEVNGFLWEAWRRLQALELLRREEGGLRLDLQAATLIAPLQVQRCPVTYTALGVTLCGLTPYLTLKLPLDRARCSAVDLPRHPEPFAKDKRRLLEWLENDPVIRAARELGLWRELADRIAAGSDYFQVGEHSAQQPSARLKQLEKQFKDGDLNILSCSTTMEMGVDIGGVSAVSMNNAPPGPANFLQRAGRAGRRGETASVSLTLCKAVPHGEAVFHNPLWPFTTPVAVPSVSLQSERLVLRHINALALNYFLRDRRADSIELKAGWFFGVSDDSPAPAELFVSWLRDERRRDEAALRDGVALLCARSCLAGLDVADLLRRSAEAFVAVQQRWLVERKALRDEMRAWESPPHAEPTPAQLALSRQIERQEGEYLLAMLSSARFLPGHGFPTGVVPFIHTNLEQLRREERERAERREQDPSRREREDSLFRRRGYPSRDIGTAIREYAPGSTVVLDGQVYRSEGVTLNWHIPAGDLAGPAEAQSFRHAWRCSHCGASGDRAMPVTECPSCHRVKPDLRCRQYLEPAGFAVDLRYQPNNDLTAREYVPVRPPWISAGGVPFQPLSRPELGRFRYNSSGHIFVHSGGERGLGYAICLRCGRAASEDDWEQGELPKALKEHLRLRGGKKRDGGGLCSGSEGGHAVKRNQLLGASAETDIFELQLREPSSGMHLSAQSTAVSLAVALRQALAEELGIEDREIGFTAIPALYDSDERGYSIVLYDTASGGAGYVATAGRLIEKLLRQAKRILSCLHRGCDRACHGCLLSYDTQFHMEHLDRRRALAFLTEQLLDGLALPAELRHFGPSSQLEFEPLLAALRRELQKPEAQELRFYVGGDQDLWDPSYWPVRRELLRYAAEQPGKLDLTVVAPKRTLEALSDDVANGLATILEGTGTHLRVIDRVAGDPAVPTLIAEVIEAGQTVRWAVADPALLVLGEDWAGGEEQERCVRGVLGSVQTAPGVIWDVSKLRRTGPGTYREVVVPLSVKWTMAQAASELWRLLLAGSRSVVARLQGEAPLREISYQDRYLSTPLTARLLADLIGWLRQQRGGANASTRVHVVTSELRQSWHHSSVNDDWEYELERTAVVEQLFQGAGVTVRFEARKKRAMPHARQLTLRWEGGVSWTVRLDHGLGFLRAIREFPHPFGRPPAEQVRQLMNQDFQTEVRDQLPVYFYIGGLQEGERR